MGDGGETGFRNTLIRISAAEFATIRHGVLLLSRGRTHQGVDAGLRCGRLRLRDSLPSGNLHLSHWTRPGLHSPKRSMVLVPAPRRLAVRSIGGGRTGFSFRGAEGRRGAVLLFCGPLSSDGV